MTPHELVATPAIAKAATSASYVSVGSALAFGLSANELGVIASIIIAGLTFAVGRWMEYHFRNKHYLLAEKKHEMLMQQWKEGKPIDRRNEDEEDRRFEKCSECPYAGRNRLRE